ncbi:SMI1/KNR4 family protein [Paenibacillus sp. MMS20-IR301]|uniref:SMI1/KNR4 family protein n=1 Tax=Paenibacillus sp. MMS20-IR301 TaxID=2895946 RepID=UPI0028E3F0CA|nr:SMI1/KNR4 family protein [Paenibacillus sp. MMS20-IR301]WNS42300.1 SMI1/KNR4 family protein [Paenibacillus sp. MMS20-IR301]
MYERLTQKLSTTSTIRWFPGHGAEESWITEAEEELGFKLPPSYRWWLTHYGNAGLGDGNILTLVPSEHREYSDSDLLYIHRLNLAEDWWVSRFPHRLDLFVPDSDELYYFDTSARNQQGEFPVMRYDLMNDLIDEYAPTFAAFLEQLIDERS